MRSLNSTNSLLSSFAKDQKGSFVPAFAISLMALFMSSGVALDYSRMSNHESFINNSLDAAVLATGRKLSDGETNKTALRQHFEDYLNSNLGLKPEILSSVTISEFNTDPASGTVNATLQSDVKMAFMSIAGYESVPVKSYAEAKFASTPVEISMMLDVTGSMRHNGKLDALKLAATDAVDILIPNGTSNTTRIGLVPYAASVNGGAYAHEASGISDDCATERQDAGLAHTDVSYETAPLTSHEEANCPNVEIQPLTNKAKKLKKQINKYNPAGYTAGHLGIAWSYYMLSENWRPLWKKKNDPAKYDAGVKKIAILMTDGEFNTFYRGVGSHHQGGQAPKSNTEATALCSDMKKLKKGNPGITIYSVAFQAPTSAKATLQNCASPDSDGETHFFDATSASELRQAFAQIATSIKNLRLSN